MKHSEHVVIEITHQTLSVKVDWQTDEWQVMKPVVRFSPKPEIQSVGRIKRRDKAMILLPGQLCFTPCGFVDLTPEELRWTAELLEEVTRLDKERMKSDPVLETVASNGPSNYTPLEVGDTRCQRKPMHS